MRNLTSIAVSAIAIAFAATNVNAATYSYWDGATDSPPGGVAAPNGTWENANWSTTSVLTSNGLVSVTAKANYVESTDAHFSAGTASTGTYTITANSAHTVSGFDMDTPGNCTITGPGALSLTATGDGIAVTNGATLYISNVIAGTAGGFLNVSGNAGFTGTLVLGGTNTFTGNSTSGGIRCITGTVVVSNDLCFGTGANSFINMDGGTLSFPAGTHTVTNKINWAVASGPLTSYLGGSGTVNFNGPIVLQTPNVSPPYIICNGTGDVFFNGAVSDNTRGALLVSGPGAGRIIFTGNNTYTGYIYLERANFALGNNASLHGQLHIDGVVASTFLQAYGGARTISQTVVFDNYQFVNNSSLGVTITGNNTLTLSGIVDLYTNNPSETITLANTADTIITGQIVDTAGGAGTGSSITVSATRGGVNINGSGRIIFKNINNTYTGDTVINSGTLCLQNASGNATGTGTVQVSGGTLTGTGAAGLVKVNSGGTIVPGNAPNLGTATLTTGTQTWAGGGHYTWEMNDSIGTEGGSDGWDVLHVSGLSITSTSGSKFNIDVTSLTQGNIAGNTANFNPGVVSTWRILHSTAAITGFDPSVINLNIAPFSNPINNGSGVFTISLANASQDLVLGFSPTVGPGITANPASTTNNIGDTVMFPVTATAVTGDTLIYKWQLNGQPLTDGPTAGATISGSDTATLTLTGIQASDLGAYTVLISNSDGSQTSNPANLVANQSITFGTLSGQTYGVAPFSLGATASSGLPVSYSVTSGPATVLSSTVTVTGAGNVTIKATQTGSTLYATAAPVSQSFTVIPATLSVTASNVSRPYGTANPVLGVSYSGYVNGDNAAKSFSGVPSVTTTATAASPVAGNPYTITVATGSLNTTNYTFSFNNGTLMVTPVSLTVTANNASRAYGAANPVFAASYSGFANSETLGTSDVAGSPALSSTDTNASVGIYDITNIIGTLTSTNYSFNLEDGTLTVTNAIATNVISSSENPALPGDAVTITATVSTLAPSLAVPYGSVQFQIDGSPFGSPVTLANGVAISTGTSSLSHGNHTIEADYAGDTNILGSTNTLTEVINTPPVAGPDTILRADNRPTQVLVATLLANDTDADNDVLALTGVSATSAQGGTVSLNAGSVFYTPPGGDPATDTFTYTNSDGFGGTATGTVTVNIGPSVNITGSVILPDGTAQLNFTGVPYQAYLIQAADSLPASPWVTIATNTADINGLFQFIDVDASNHTTRFYQTAIAP